MYAVARHRRYNTIRGGSWKRHVKEGITNLARRANTWLKDTRFISTRAKAHNHGLIRALGEAAEHFGYGRGCRKFAVNAHHRKVCRRRKTATRARKAAVVHTGRKTICIPAPMYARKTMNRPAGAAMAY